MSEEQREEEEIREMQALAKNVYNLFAKAHIQSVLTVCVGGIERTIRRFDNPDEMREKIIETMRRAKDIDLNEEG